MKRYIKENNNLFRLRVVVEVEFLSEAESVAASYDSERFNNSELPPAAKDALIDSQVLADYHAFVETLEDVMTDYFGLELYYKNDSPYNSFYYGALAVNDEGDYILDCEATIRISTHDPHRTSESEKEKAKQKAKLNEIAKGKRLQPVRKNIVINDKEFSNYEDAYEFAFSQIERAASVLNRKKDV